MLQASLSRFFLTVLIVTGLVAIVIAQDTLLTVSYNGKLDSINSAALNQKRFVQVFVPSGYKPGSADKYDVLYVFDGGNWNMNVVAPLQRFIQNEGQMPPTIIVSVMGIDRNIELTPTVLKSWNAPTGGADKFLAFIKNELIPYINKSYPSNGDNTLWGHSLGGMFVTWAMLKEPLLFKSVIAVDPSMWWDDCYVPKMAAARLKALPDSTITFFMSGREGPALQEMKIDTMETMLRKYAPPNLKWKLVTYKGESHSSLRMRATYDGLKFTYEGQTSAIEFAPMNGIIAKGQPYKIYYTDDTAYVHYTLDGAVPTAQSPKASHELTVTGPATVTYKQISNRARYGKSTTGQFIAESLPPPTARLHHAKPGGLTYRYYEGTGKGQPDLKTAALVKKGILDKNFKADSLHPKNNFALLMDGYLQIKEDGYYTFIMRAGKGSKAWIGKKLIMQWDDNANGAVFTYLMPLSKGFYPVKIESFYKKEDFNFLFYYLTPGMPASGDAVPVPFDLEYGTDENKH
jgi:predicted alpha/beta superfamily hydrolase